MKNIRNIVLAVALAGASMGIGKISAAQSTVAQGSVTQSLGEWADAKFAQVKTFLKEKTEQDKAFLATLRGLIKQKTQEQNAKVRQHEAEQDALYPNVDEWGQSIARHPFDFSSRTSIYAYPFTEVLHEIVVNWDAKYKALTPREFHDKFADFHLQFIMQGEDAETFKMMVAQKDGKPREIYESEAKEIIQAILKDLLAVIAIA